MNYISGNGVKILVAASKTFPVGFPVTQLADDVDPLDFPDLQIAETAMGLNGDMLSWTTPVPIEFTLAVIPNTKDDIALSLLHEANRASKDKSSAEDVITITIIFPNLRPIVLRKGTLLTGSNGLSISSSKRMKSKSYTFHFEDQIG
tara:strand:- start:74 stop:514 length:441 start_codon:yes stop_codon:yes gene_type:complete